MLGRLLLIYQGTYTGADPFHVRTVAPGPRSSVALGPSVHRPNLLLLHTFPAASFPCINGPKPPLPSPPNSTGGNMRTLDQRDFRNLPFRDRLLLLRVRGINVAHMPAYWLDSETREMLIQDAICYRRFRGWFVFTHDPTDDMPPPPPPKKQRRED